jgi:opacity protein-like surface antigen
MRVANPAAAMMRTALAVLGLSLWAAPAQADGWISPFVGVNFGGDAGGTFSQAAKERQHVVYGLDAGGMFGGVFGLEFDLGYTRHFFGTGPTVSDSSVFTAMPALIIGIPIGGQRGPGFRPYATAGLGVFHRSLNIANQSIFDGNSLGYSVGFGAMGFLGTNFGIRGDYRYFRNVETDEIALLDIRRGTFDFSRASIGAVFRF